MTVLVTGGAGFIGSHLVEQLLSAGRKVRVLDNLSMGKKENLPLAVPDLEFIEGDIRDPMTVEKCVAGVSAIVHLAAVASVQASIDDPLSTHQSNFDGTLHLLEAARKHQVGRFLYACSAAVYGDTEVLPVPETLIPKPLSPYAVDKLAGEYYLLYYFNKHGLNATSFRFFNIYGPRQDPSSPYSGVISIFVDRLRAGGEVTVFGDGKQTRDFVYVKDLATLLAEALERTDLGGAVTNVGTGRECSLLQLLDALESISGKTLKRNFADPRVGDIRYSRADVTRLQSLFSRIPATPIQQGLKALLDYA
ncbi:MAG: NAD-dependent epimerase/dehydratase family protein [Gammaproteobacteria bacterium]|nr:NAD-dependent epimerase/dehydratase family protein [Gammaproteobacteria bacterium]